MTLMICFSKKTINFIKLINGLCLIRPHSIKKINTNKNKKKEKNSFSKDEIK